MTAPRQTVPPRLTHARRALTTCLVTSVVAATGLSAAAASAASSGDERKPVSHSARTASLELSVLGSYATGSFDEASAEIVAFHGNRLFVVNAKLGAVDVLDISNPTSPTKVTSITSEGVANSVAIRADGLGVIALESPTKTDPGRLVFFDAAAPVPTALGAVTVGALPDMVTITPDGERAVVAIEGEPSENYAIDPEGGVGIVDLPATVSAPAQTAVRIADFHAFEATGSKVLDDDVRVYGPRPHADLPVSRNLEPEYVAIGGSTAYVALQENNAVAEVDLARGVVTDVWALGAKDHGKRGHGLDANDVDKKIGIRPYEDLRGLYMPDGINAYRAGGKTYLVTANEGDARVWGDFSEEVRVKDLGTGGVAPACAGVAADLIKEAGRLKVSTVDGLRKDGSCYEELHAFGGRSFSIWTRDGEQVFDSGDDYEHLVAKAVPEAFNTDHAATKVDSRSDDKGPEPENLTIGEVEGRTYAFVGLERVGGVVVHDITNPRKPTFVTYVNNRDVAVDMSTATDVPTDLARAGDLGPEGLTFLPAATSPTGRPMLAVGNEVSGTTTLLDIVSVTKK
jgi:5'-nucleotidase